MANRPLIRKLTSLLPNLHIIERDYTIISNAKTPHSLLPDLEADITLSPTTGLLLTNLQKLKQRPLPGQEATSPPNFTTQLTAISRRYERLRILITDGRDTAHPTPDENDTSTLNALITYTSMLATSVSITFIPGKEADLSSWIAATISHHAYSSSSSDEETTLLLQDETVWERFLRKAGMNAFAAQGVLAQVKKMSALEEERGLAAFVIMSPEERVRRFAGIMGGERVLWRVNWALERKWLSASNEMS